MRLHTSLFLKNKNRSSDSRSEGRNIWRIATALNCAMAYVVTLLIAAPVQAQTESLLHSFKGSPDGSASYAALKSGPKASFYSSTSLGGQNGYGAVYKISAKGAETVLYSFAGFPDGAYPAFAPVAFDKAGNLYGTTYQGGANNLGAVFKLTPSGTENIVYSFAGGSDGYNPNSGVILDAAGNLYGTTVSGGANGFGTVFTITPSGSESVLYSFAGGSNDGCFPYADGLTLWKNKMLYGTTVNCGVDGVGTVFSLTLSGAETVLHTFRSDGIDGVYPYAGVVVDKAGNIYGTTEAGGTSNAGTVYKITSKGTESVVYSFAGSGGDGANPYGAGLVLDAAHNLYGTTNLGGVFGVGTVFKITSSGTESILHHFKSDGSDGSGPTAGLVLKKNVLYGTTLSGGANGAGTVFKLVP